MGTILRFLRIRWISLVVAACYAAITCLADFVVSHTLFGIQDHELSVVSLVYEPILRLTDKPFHPTHTSLIELGRNGDGFDPEFDLCRSRQVVAETLSALATLPQSGLPKAVLVDMVFTTNFRCGEDKELINAAYSLRHRGVTLNFGITFSRDGSKLLNVLSPNQSPDESNAPCPSDVREKTAVVDSGDIGKGGVGLVDLPRDPRQVAIAYPPRPTSRSSSGPQSNTNEEDNPMMTMPFMVYLQEENPNLQRYIALASSNDYSVLFHVPLKRQSWEANNITNNRLLFGLEEIKTLAKYKLSELRGRFVIVGSANDLNSAQAGVSDGSGKADPGFFRQASALEAFLNDRIFTKLNPVLQFWLAFGFWFSLGCTDSIRLRTLLVFGWFIFLAILNIVLIIWIKQFGDFAFISTVGLLFCGVEWINHMLKHSLTEYLKHFNTKVQS
jgi:hypothetical protein